MRAHTVKELTDSGLRASRNRHYAMIALNLAIVAVVSVVFILHESSTARRWEIVSTYHLASAHSAQQAGYDLTLLQADIIAAAATDRGGDGAHAPAVGDLLYRLSEDRRTLAALQKEFALPQFAELTALTDHAFANLFEIQRTQGSLTTGQEVHSAITLLALRLQQLDRLNLAAAEQATASGAVYHARDERTLLILFFVLVGTTGFVSAGIMRRLAAASEERVAAVMRMQEVSASLDAFFDGAPSGMAIIDRDLNCRKWNQTLARMGGKDASNFDTACRMVDLLPAEHARALMLAFQHTFETGEPFLNMEFSGPASSGHGPKSHWVASHFPVREETGETETLGLVVTDVSELKDVEEMLRTARNLNEAVLDTANALVVVLDCEGRFLRFNRACELLTGYAAKDMIGTSLWEKLFREEEIGPARQTFESMTTDKVAGEFEYTWLTSEGQARLIAWNSSVILDDTGDVEFVVGIGLDVTERKQAERDLTESAHRLAVAQRIASLGSWEWRPETDAVIWSEQTFQIFGLEPGATPTGNGILELVHPEDRESLSVHMQTAVESGTPYTAEYRVPRNDGETRFILEHAEPLRDGDTGAVRLMGTVQDITERKISEKKLALTAERLSNAQRIAQLGSWSWNIASDTLTWSDELHRMFGQDPGTAPTVEAYREMVHPEDSERVREAEDRSLADGQPYSIEYRIVRPDGEIRTLYEHSEIECDKNGAPVAVYGTDQDITERKQAEQSRAETAHNLAEAQRIGQIGSWELDPENGTFEWSDEIYRIFGLDPGTFTPTYDTFLQTIHPDDREAMIARYNRATANDTMESIEYRVIRPGSETRIIQSRGEIVHNADGTIRRLRGTIQDITERKRAEQALRESEARLSTFFDEAPAGMVIFDSDGRYVMINEPLARLSGVPAEEHAGKKPSEVLLSPALGKQVEDINRQALESGEAVRDFEYSIQAADGSGPRTFSSTWFPITGPTGETVGTASVALNITERRQAEQALQESEARLDAFFNKAPVSLGIVDSDYRYVKINESLACMNGAAAEAHIGNQPCDVMPPEKAVLINELLRRTLESGESIDGEESTVPGPDGPPRHRVYTQFPISGDPQNPDTVGLIIRDVTERRLVEHALRESEERLDAFFTEAPVGLGIIDGERRYLKLNETLARSNGRPVADHIGKTPSDLFPAEMAKMVESVMDRTLVGGEQIVNEEASAVTADGTTRFWAYSQYPLPGEDKSRGALGVAAVDITELKTAQEDLARLNAELEARVEMRTAELRDAQAELVKRERLATLGQLTATVSHELRNPLGAMRTSMYIVEKKTEGRADTVSRAIERVNRSITRCDQIIDELLDYTRIRRLEIKAVPIEDWLAGVLDEQAVPDGVEIRRKFRALAILAQADTDRLRRAVINVYENACHAVASPGADGAPRAKKLMTIETRVRKDRFEIIVSDNGPGIPADIRDKVFEPLFSTRNFGVGLGLPTVWQIMEQHGGGVTVGKTRGGGAKFSLWLRLAPEMEMTEA